MIDELRPLTGAACDRMFSQQVVQQHRVAIQMIDHQMPMLKEASIKAMAERMKRDQTREIEEVSAEDACGFIKSACVHQWARSTIARRRHSEPPVDGSTSMPAPTASPRKPVRSTPHPRAPKDTLPLQEGYRPGGISGAWAVCGCLTASHPGPHCGWMPAARC